MKDQVTHIAGVYKDGDTDPYEQYVWGVRYVDELIQRQQDSDTDGTVDETHYVLQDANFNVTAIVDTSGDVVERYIYSPYGEQTVLDDDWSADSDGLSDVGMLIGFQGLLHDSESGLIYNRHRMFHSVVGRFTTRDPLTYVDGASMYSGYHVIAGEVDPFGLEVKIVARRVSYSWGTGVHTFIVVTDKNGNKYYFSGYKGPNGELIIEENWKTDVNWRNDKKIKDERVIPPPGGKTQNEWDEAVIIAGRRRVGESGKREYDAVGADAQNCNHVSTSIIVDAGGTIPGDFDPSGRNPGLGECLTPLPPQTIEGIDDPRDIPGIDLPVYA